MNAVFKKQAQRYRDRVPAWSATSAEQFVDDLLRFMREEGATRYDDAVSQLDHALQAAHLADRSNAPSSEVAAALLHDVGHLLLEEHDAQGDFLDVDLEHEIVGAEWLAQIFPLAVTDPIREHVNAKRFLCTVDERYRSRLSRASQRSLELQGGLMSQGELQNARELPHFESAIALRRRDDGAKVQNREVPDLEHYRALLESLVQS